VPQEVFEALRFLAVCPFASCSGCAPCGQNILSSESWLGQEPFELTKLQSVQEPVQKANWTKEFHSHQACLIPSLSTIHIRDIHACLTHSPGEAEHPKASMRASWWKINNDTSPNPPASRLFLSLPRSLLQLFTDTAMWISVRAADRKLVRALDQQMAMRDVLYKLCRVALFGCLKNLGNV
jgi:hypothetical protein